MKGMSMVAALVLAGGAQAAQPGELLAGYEAEARGAESGFRASASRGERFFNARHGGEWSCASCHGNPPVGQGKHAKTGKAIAPLAPAANAERFADAAKVEKWFRRNCNDVLSRACTPSEKADVLAWLLK
jgi:hypothetical protein